MATHFSIPAWRIPWTEEPGGLQSMRSQKLNMTERLNHHQAGPEVRNSTESGVFFPLSFFRRLSHIHTHSHTPAASFHFSFTLLLTHLMHYFFPSRNSFCLAIQLHRECSRSRFPATLLVLQVTLTSFTVSLLWLLTAKSDGRIPSFAGSLLAQAVKNLPAMQETWV